MRKLNKDSKKMIMNTLYVKLQDLTTLLKY